jgi:hypothetical protein
MCLARSWSYIAGLLIISWAGVAGANPIGWLPGPKIAMHAKAHTSKTPTQCTSQSPTIPCSQYVTSWPVSSPADVYIVVAQAEAEPGVAGLQCGIDFDGRPGQGVDVMGFEVCADFQFANPGSGGEVWPEAGSGIILMWEPTLNCQRTVIGSDGVHAVAGCFYVYAYSGDVLRVIPDYTHPPGPQVKVWDCSGVTTDLLYVPGWVNTSRIAFGPDYLDQGCNPCLVICAEPVAVKNTSWGRLKTRFQE